MKKYLKCMAMLVTTSLFAACGNTGKKASLEDLAGEWTIMEVDGKPVKTEEEPFLGFQVTDMQLYGNAGCNSLMGLLEVGQADALSFGTLGSTKRMCADMQVEDAIFTALGKVKRFALDAENRLILMDADGQELMELVARNQK